ncbi:MAG: hypothetical protein RL317_1112, partial [Pseudomonadota bacterium]
TLRAETLGQIPLIWPYFCLCGGYLETPDALKPPETWAFQVRSVNGDLVNRCVEARAGIEPAYTDLQSAASPLRHRASRAVRGGLCVEKDRSVNQ